MILALESVFDQCSVACVDLTGKIIVENTLTGKRSQTQQILPMVHELMAAASLQWSQLTAIAFNRGPGAFSGIRINTAVAQAIAFAHDLPCLPISSLQAVAQQALILNQMWQSDNHCYAVIDARMNQVYMGEFYAQAVANSKIADGFPMIDGEPMIMMAKGNERLEDYGYQTNDIYPLVGDGNQLLTANHGQKAYLYNESSCPSASVIGQLGLYYLAQGQAVCAEQALPVYLRHNAWKTLAEQNKT